MDDNDTLDSNSAQPESVAAATHTNTERDIQFIENETGATPSFERTGDVEAGVETDHGRTRINNTVFHVEIGTEGDIKCTLLKEQPTLQDIQDACDHLYATLHALDEPVRVRIDATRLTRQTNRLHWMPVAELSEQFREQEHFHQRLQCVTIIVSSPFIAEDFAAVFGTQYGRVETAEFSTPFIESSELDGSFNLF